MSEWTRIKLHGNFDGNGITLNDLNDSLFDKVGEKGIDPNTYTIKNININADIRTNYAAALVKSAAANMVIENVDVKGTIEGTNGATSYISFGPTNGSGLSTNSPFNVTFRDCISEATVIATGDSATGFIKHPYMDDTQSLLIIEDSAFIGKLSAVNENSMCYFSTVASTFKGKVTYSEEFRSSMLSDYRVNVDTLVTINPDENGIINAARLKYNVDANRSVLEVVNGDLSLTTHGAIIPVDQHSDAVKAIVSLEVAPNDADGFGGYLGTFLSETLTLTPGNSTFNTNNVKYFKITINGGGDTGVVGDDTFNVKHSKNGTTHNGARVRVVQYDNNDNIVRITTFTVEAATTPPRS